jgi:hypothetical protein
MNYLTFILLISIQNLAGKRKPAVVFQLSNGLL